jgi:glycosyltransferase involved in cell wall biosynthesis
MICETLPDWRITVVGVNHGAGAQTTQHRSLPHVRVTDAQDGDDLYGAEKFRRLAASHPWDLLLTVQDAHNASAWGPWSPPAPHLFYTPIDGAVGHSDTQALRCAHRVVSATQWGAQILKDRVGIHSDVLPHETDGRVFYPAMEEERAQWKSALFDAGHNEIALLAVGVNIARKQWGRILEVVRACNSERRTVRLLCHTAPVFKGLSIPRMCSALNLTGLDVAFTSEDDRCGSTDAWLRRLYCAADFLISASSKEGWCLPIIEASACGTPVVGPRYGPYLENLGDAAYLAPPTSLHWIPGDPRGPGIDVAAHSLFDTLQTAISSEKSGASKSEAARHAAQRFDVGCVRPLWRRYISDFVGGR